MFILVGSRSNWHHVPKTFSSNKLHLLGGSPAAQGSQQSLLDSGMCFYFRSWKLNQGVFFTLNKSGLHTEASRVDLNVLWTWVKPGPCPELSFSEAQRAICSNFLCVFVSRVTNVQSIVLYAGLVCIHTPSNHTEAATTMPQAFPCDSGKNWIQNIRFYCTC